MSTRRAALCVPASEEQKIAKACASRADEVVVDLEDAVAVAQKVPARANLALIAPREHGLVSVRVNATDTPWFSEDVATAHANPAITSVIVPKVEHPRQIEQIESLLARIESEQRSTRPEPIRVQALVESAAGVVRASEIAGAGDRLEAIILGYADLAASLGRRQSASWQYAQDSVIFSARAAGIQAIDGPVLTVHDDETLRSAAAEAQGLGFDGKWVIHPRQVDTVLAVFTPSADEVEDARGILDAMRAAEASGAGAVEWRGRMLDEAIAVQARRILSMVAE